MLSSTPISRCQVSPVLHEKLDDTSLPFCDSNDDWTEAEVVDAVNVSSQALDQILNKRQQVDANRSAGDGKRRAAARIDGRDVSALVGKVRRCLRAQCRDLARHSVIANSWEVPS